MEKLSLKIKLIGGFLAITFLVLVASIVAFIGITSLQGSAIEMRARMADEITANKTSFWAIKQYQLQADSIINQNLALEKDFDEAAVIMDEFRDLLKSKLDTPAEMAWINEFSTYDEAFDGVFHDKIIPELEHQAKNTIQVLDGRSDVFLATAAENADKLIASLKDEMVEELGIANSPMLVRRVNDLEKAMQLKEYMLKQYQVQADLIINQNLELVDEFAEVAVKMDETIEYLKDAVDTPEEIRWIADVEEANNEFSDIFTNDVTAEVNRILENRIGVYDAESDEALAKMSEIMDKIIVSLQAEADEAVENSDNTAAFVITLLAISAIISVIAGLGLGFYLANAISNPINAITENLSMGSDQVNSAAGQIAETSETLSQGASEQAASMEETAASLAALAETSRETVELSDGAADLMKINIQKSVESLEAMAEMTSKMNQIESDSSEMLKIIKTIDEIAFQTNLLALNAAVEAARAGEHGKGFAVVAEEVRNLAIRASEASKGTQGLLEGTVSQVSDTATAIREVNDNFETIVESATEMGEKLDTMSEATKGQLTSIEQIDTATKQVADVTQQIAAGSEETASSSEELSAQSAQLRSAVNQLSLLIHGNNDSSANDGQQNTNQQPAPGRNLLLK
jgi:methyl-accepting chemotaxis protein